MEPALLAAAGWLEAVGLRQWASATPWVYPAANVLHVFGLAMLVGGIGIVDLRIAGLWRSLPLAALNKALTPVAVAGLAVLVVSGVTLFAADGTTLSRSAIFQWKLLLIAAALANVVLFRMWWQPRITARATDLPLRARALAVLSLLLWVVIGTLGRLIAYV
ncbi:MAG: hypothetical protein B7Z08_05645 [Sphingomonadales bacterium 32-68-7]|nr:MAG: hypothetical protein B7Z33_03620 [Sphingomonadales bacterium 12-68-11]OYX09397.1 MAG: hypothetical protein B7Z08_05645 [Sphingomonadales bacterium 32-68-7]